MADARASVAGETPEQTGERRDIATRFKPGQSGNPAGRKKGARARLAEAFIQDMYEAWQTRGAEVIQRVIEDRPHVFIKAVAGLQVKEVNVTTTAVQELSDDDISAALAALRSVGALAHAGSGSETAPRH
jgi:hypothetical protein